MCVSPCAKHCGAQPSVCVYVCRMCVQGVCVRLDGQEDEKQSIFSDRVTKETEVKGERDKPRVTHKNGWSATLDGGT